jgi:outer membrane protein assembly factor BamB
MKGEKEMQHSKVKTILSTAIIVILLVSSVFFLANLAVPAAQAQLSATQPTTTIPSGATPYHIVASGLYLSEEPDPTGVGQAALVNAWISPSPGTDRAFQQFTFTITKPDGTVKDTFSLNTEPDTGALWFNYVFDTAGDWKIKVEFAGTYFPAGRYLSGYIVTNNSGTLYTGDSWYGPEPAQEKTVHVQSEFVPSWPPSPLPTDYWTRPVDLHNREWLAIIGDYPWYGPAYGDPDFPADTNPTFTTKNEFIPYVQAPNSGHIAWEREWGIAGMTGAGRYGDVNNLASGYYEYPVPIRTTSTTVTPLPCIIAGRGYQTNTKMVNGVATPVFECYDIRTGENIWEAVYSDFTIPSSTQSFGQWVWQGGIEYSNGNPTIIYIIPGQLLKINPTTGAISNYTLNLPVTESTVISPVTAGTYYMNGFALSVQNMGSGVYRLLNWTTLGTSSNFASRIVSNVSWPFSNLGGGGVDFDVGIALNSGSGWPGTAGTLPGVNMVAVDIRTGNILWNKTFENLVTYATVSSMCDHGLFAFLTDHGTFQAYRLTDGALVWESERMDYPWDASGFGAYDTSSAYGLFYREAYSGIYAFNWTNGKIVWKYEAPNVPFETPYTGKDGNNVNSFNGYDLIADGKLYSINTEHTPTQPITRGWGLHCMDARTGEPIWNITTGGGTVDAVADGYLSVSDSYSGYQYVFGKGKSATTVTAPDTVLPLGSGLVIKGTVLDMSPAQPNTPCVSKDSMKTQMEYLHFQYPIGGIWGNLTITGVPVTLTAIGSDGSVTDLGSVTTDGYYGTFSKAWTPIVKGDYQIIASFAGDDSYGSSSAATAVSIGPAPAPIELPPAAEQIDYSMMLYAVLAAVIVAIIIGIVAILITLRKR